MFRIINLSALSNRPVSNLYVCEKIQVVYFSDIYTFPFSTGLLLKNPSQNAYIIETSYLHLLPPPSSMCRWFVLFRRSILSKWWRNQSPSPPTLYNLNFIVCVICLFVWEKPWKRDRLYSFSVHFFCMDRLSRTHIELWSPWGIVIRSVGAHRSKDPQHTKTNNGNMASGISSLALSFPTLNKVNRPLRVLSVALGRPCATNDEEVCCWVYLYSQLASASPIFFFFAPAPTSI